MSAEAVPSVSTVRARADAEPRRIAFLGPRVWLDGCCPPAVTESLSSTRIEFDARFAGVIHHVRFPVTAVLGIYARETGEGMVFSEQDLGPEPPTRPTPAEEGGPRRPQLKVVK